MVETDTVSPTRGMTKHSRQTEDNMETDMVSHHISIPHKSTTVKQIDLSWIIFSK